MSCPKCDPFDTEVAIHGRDQLVKIAGQISGAVRDGILVYNHAESSRFQIGQPHFSDLNPDQLPDVLYYRFNCASCASAFELSAETYHGRGGHWKSH